MPVLGTDCIIMKLMSHICMDKIVVKYLVSCRQNKKQEIISTYMGALPSRGGDSAHPRQRGIHTFCFWDTIRIHTLEPWDTHVIHENHDKKERDLEQPPHMQA